MLSPLHEALVGIVDEQPELIATMLSDFEVPALAGEVSIQSVSEKLGTASPPELRADGLLQVQRDGKTILVIVVEVQLATDPNKLYSWPAYVSGARLRYQCDAMLVVLAPSESVASWARRPILVGPVVGTFQPVVIGPTEMPIVIDPMQARQYTELAVFSAIYHGHDKDVSLAERIAQTAIQATLALPDRAPAYTKILFGRASATRSRRV